MKAYTILGLSSNLKSENCAFCPFGSRFGFSREISWLVLVPGSGNLKSLKVGLRPHGNLSTFSSLFSSTSMLKCTSYFLLQRNCVNLSVLSNLKSAKTGLAPHGSLSIDFDEEGASDFSIFSSAMAFDADIDPEVSI